LSSTIHIVIDFARYNIHTVDIDSTIVEKLVAMYWLSLKSGSVSFITLFF